MLHATQRTLSICPLLCYPSNGTQNPETRTELCDGLLVGGDDGDAHRLQGLDDVLVQHVLACPLQGCLGMPTPMTEPPPFPPPTTHMVVAGIPS